ncbi:MAG: glycogen/starch/alpha-glucan phosphorylase [Clostridiales bacterium]|nr:glycogen/starch/alpha-glucan phosphorylase [Candidatus Crickella equi]
MIRTKEDFKEQYSQQLHQMFGRSIELCDEREKYEALVRLVRIIGGEINQENELSDRDGKKVYYFSMEFLIGRLLENYLINLGIRDAVSEGLAEMGSSLESICECEADPGLGNGGLGRLAACFMDSIAALNINGDGMGLRYRFGLFKQKIENGYQVELPDAWMDDGHPWGRKRASDSIIVKFGGKVEREYKDGEMEYHYVGYDCVKAVPYDVPLIGFGGKTVNTLHLWDAQPVHDNIDMDAFNRGEYSEAMKDKCDIQAITSILYPNDNNGIGRKLRLKQEYFLVAAGIGHIIRDFKSRYGNNAWNDFPNKVAIHINDTHPTMCIPELMRVLMDDEGLEWDEAWDITTRTISFTNHTVLPEALEKWDIAHFSELLPRIYMIIEEINRRWEDSIPQGMDQDMYVVKRHTSVLWDGEIRMANLSVIGSYSVNGVSALHSDILTNSVFKDFYTINPEKFNNKTNGISHRRFMIQSNPSLTNLINEYIGTDWQSDFNQIEKLKMYEDDLEFLNKLINAKRENKIRIAKYIKKHMDIDVDPDSVFDVQVKRMHAYKRQILNGFKILNLYNILKENPEYPINNYTFIIAGKAAQGYAFAKSSIKFINSLADMVNSDPVVNKRMKVVFIENFCVSNAQLIYPAADISEQISTAGKEASGTGNMKFMINGAVTLGTMDGANVEINDLVGPDNISIFGYSSDETENFYRYGGYNAVQKCNQDPRLQKMLGQLVDGTFADSGCNFWDIYDSLLKQNDEYFVLGDFDSYFNAWLELDRAYSDRMKWGKMSLANIANSAFFSSDRTIREYADDIWGL